MRKSALPVLLSVLALASCDEPTGRPTAAADALWKLAPEGTRGAVVLSPYAIKMIETGSLSLRSFIDKAGMEMTALDEQLTAILAPLGGKQITLADLGLTATKGGALFFVKDGMVAVLPIADRDAFVAKAHGTRATTPDGTDTISGKPCRLFGTAYVCATSEAVLATVGKSKIKERLTPVRARGDIEVIATELPLEGPEMPRSSIAAIVQIERGAWLVRGVIGNPPQALATKLTSAEKPRTRIGKSSGFAVLDLRPFIDPTEDLVVEGVTQAQLVKSMAGAVTLDVAAGSSVLDMQLPLSDPKPFQTIVDRCDQAEILRQLGAKKVGGVCHVDLAQMNLSLDLWVDGQTLHLGKKGAAPTDVSVAMPKPAIELATGTWGLAFWGRGTMFAPTGKPPIEPAGINPLITTPLRTMAMVDEIGFGVKQDGELLRFLLTMRTAFADPDPVVAKVTDITAVDVLTNHAEGKGKAVVAEFPRSQFAADYAAGQHGMVVPTQMLFAAVQTIIPALMSYTRGDQAPAEGNDQFPPGALTKLRVQGYATDGFDIWKKANPGKACPASMADLAKSISPDATYQDEWGKDLVMVCGGKLPEGAKGIAIVSPGPDGQLGTDDDVKSY